MMVKTHNKTIK